MHWAFFRVIHRSGGPEEILPDHRFSGTTSTDNWIVLCSSCVSSSLQPCQGLSDLLSTCPLTGFQHYPYAVQHATSSLYLPCPFIPFVPVLALQNRLQSSPWEKTLSPCVCCRPKSRTSQVTVSLALFVTLPLSTVSPALRPTSLPSAVSSGGYPAPSHPPSARLPPPPPVPSPRPTVADTLHTVLGVWVVGVRVRLRHLGGLVKQICHTVG